ncbi:MAG TPA: hypothetical protein ENK89_06640 [Desulfobulbaceae bacterium]|nr:hypothetical protein [Desulfobulbaceae bacterium]
MKVVLITGASGSGKDSLLKGIKKNGQGHTRMVLIKRFITRPPDAHEENFFVDDSAFELLRNNDFFISCWQAHGNSYGIAANHLDSIRENSLAIVSVSRTAVKDFESKYPFVYTILVEVDRDTLKQRLLKRKREQGEAIDRRLQRQDIKVKARELIRFDNSAPLDQTVPVFNQLLSNLGAR